MKRDLSPGTNIVVGESGFDVEMEDQLQEIRLATGGEQMSQLNEEDFEIKSESEISFEKGVSFPETNIVGESVFNIEVEDEPQETKLATGAEKMSQLNEESEIPFEKGVSFPETNIVGESVFNIEIEDEPQETKLDISSNVQNSSRDELENKDARIKENVGETTFEMSACVANSYGQNTNEVEIDKELGQASFAEENVPNKQESEEDASEGISNEEEDSLEEDDGICEGEIELEESSGDTGSV